MSEKSRLQKILASSGVASRRKAEELIAAGRVTVNGRVARLGDSAVPGKDTIALDGKPLGKSEKKIYLALHKPRGFVTTLHDERGRKCVAQLVEDVGERVYPVGRLDKDSEGLLLLTNDGEFANRVAHPTRHVAKTYRVTVRPSVTEDQLNQMSTGIVIEGRRTAPAKVRVLQQELGRVVLEIGPLRGPQPGNPQDVRGPGPGGGPPEAHRRGPRAAGYAAPGKIPGADQGRAPRPGGGDEERSGKR